MVTDTLPVAWFALCGISIILSILTVFLVLWVWAWQPSSKESPSFTICLWIALSDLPARICDILTNPLTFAQQGSPNHPAYVRLVTFLTCFSLYCFIYLSSMVALDLHLVLFHRLPRQATIRKWYPAIGAGIAFVFALPILAIPQITGSTTGAITMGLAGSAAQGFATVLLMIALHLGPVYSIVVIFSMLVKMVRSRLRMRALQVVGTGFSHSQLLLRNVSLVATYPILLLLVIFPYVLYLWLCNYGNYVTVRPAYYTAFTLFTLHGIMFFIVFMCHPIMLSAYRQRVFTWHPHSTNAERTAPSWTSHTDPGTNPIITIGSGSNGRPKELEHQKDWDDIPVSTLDLAVCEVVKGSSDMTTAFQGTISPDTMTLRSDTTMVGIIDDESTWL
ncbi:hypothetical protein IWQ62_004429 [Dispira parvispora]|uniref:Uncharacterized protein n=1 Tax=Dispira parvispora TaxID=1520584 RepID=A0A9W8E5M2_9FUNG|nr:hypothetical protein IWQ62_004429 [Dispira parvispora]